VGHGVLVIVSQGRILERMVFGMVWDGVIGVAAGRTSAAPGVVVRQLVGDAWGIVVQYIALASRCRAPSGRSVVENAENQIAVGGSSMSRLENSVEVGTICHSYRLHICENDKS